MRRADRLFRLVQLLSDDRDVTAKQLAEKLEVSERTVYRDMQDLSLSGVPVQSEAGRGYRLMPGFRLSPLMFDKEEIAALLLGIRMINAWADRDLARAAQRVIEKIQAVVPERLHDELNKQELLVPDFGRDNTVQNRLGEIRRAIGNLNSIHLHYQREDGEKTHRQIQPLGLFYWGSNWTFVGWCELRNNFRHFRLDRILELKVLDEQFVVKKDRRLQDYLAMVRCEH